MKTFVVVGIFCIVLAVALPRRKRAAYDLPDGAVEVVGNIKTTFQCPNDIVYEGYFADVDNNCQIFHICERSDTEIIQTSYFCGNLTVFNQLTFTCASPKRAIPCNQAPDFFYLNAKIGQPNALFLEDADIQKARAAFQRG